MGQAPGIITEILTKVDYCEFCDRPADSENDCNIYTIDQIDACDQSDLAKNIIVLCTDCKRNYDKGIFGKKHLKACVMLRNPELSEWLSALFESYDIRLKPAAPNKGLLSRVLNKLVNDQRHIDNAMLIFGAFFVLAGVLMFSYGFGVTGSNAVDAGQSSPGYLFNQFLGLAGVALAFIGLFFELRMVNGPGKAAQR